MTARWHFGRMSRLILAFGAGVVPASDVTAQSSPPPPPPTIVWDRATAAGATSAVRVENVPLAMLDQIKNHEGSSPSLTVHLADADGSVPPDRPPILGAYRVLDGTTLRFTPRFPLDATRRYRATFDPDGPAGPARPTLSDRPATPQVPATPTLVTRIEPTGDRLPANLLKFYVHFSAPMGRGDAYDHLRLADAAGKPLDRPFLELGEELWDPTQTRLTVLLDPGRIKRGLRPHEELGPIFAADQTYTLQIDPTWCDATGKPLGAPASKRFTTTPADETSPDPKTWAITAPHAGSTDPLVVRFQDTLDRATVASGLTLLDPQGVEVRGAAEALLDGTGWQFAPARAWVEGAYTLMINPDLEDLAGNSIRRPFEVDVQRDVPVIPEVNQVRLPVVIRR